MQRGFIGRERELAEMQERWYSGGPEPFIGYGRRRVGKTELLLQFSRMDNKKTLYFLASLATRHEAHLEEGLSADRASKTLGEDAPLSATYVAIEGSKVLGLPTGRQH
jgi:AAA+ ATPase superfamily predicted ATPase